MSKPTLSLVKLEFSRDWGFDDFVVFCIMVRKLLSDSGGGVGIYLIFSHNCGPTLHCYMSTLVTEFIRSKPEISWKLP